MLRLLTALVSNIVRARQAVCGTEHYHLHMGDPQDMDRGRPCETPEKGSSVVMTMAYKYANQSF